MIANDISDQNIFRRGGGTVFPLFRYSQDGELVQPNLASDAVTTLAKNLSYSPEPLDILDFVYATLHSARFRTLYADFLKSDFPRIPVPRSDDHFKVLVALGTQLRELHLVTSPLVFDFVTDFPIAGSDAVVTPSFDGQRVWINKTQYFDHVPAVAWRHVVGGTQPAEKWLKDRKGRILSGPEIDHYQAIITALSLTVDVMAQIDAPSLWL
jgi:predicted helicase